MKLRNKKTGEIGKLEITKKHCAVTVGNGTASCGIEIYNSLAELNEVWEDYKEPKGYFYIRDGGNIDYYRKEGTIAERHKSIGNYFETKEETEKAVEKLKAWKRLRDKGFRFTWAPLVGSLDKIQGKFQIEINADMPTKWFSCDDVQKDLEDCFGGEE